MNGSIVCPKCQCTIELRASVLPSMQKEVNVIFKGEIGELLDRAKDVKLNKWEEEFINGLTARYEEYGDRVKLTEKQREILTAIANK